MKSLKAVKILKYVSIGLVCLFALEFIYFGIKMINIRKKTTYYSALNSIIKTDSGYVGVGLSDSKHSDFIDYEKPGYNKPYLYVYNKDFKIEKEVKLDIGYNGEYKDIVKYDDGYIAVGNVEVSLANHKDNATEATIVKYDKDFNIVWRKNYNLMGNSSYNAVKIDNDSNIIVCGSTVFESSAIGYDTKGGALLIKYDKDGERLLEVTKGGPLSSATFNDVVVLDDGYIAVGVTQKGTGIVYKYDKDFNEVWHNYYGYTDKEGITSITKIDDNNFIMTASHLFEKDKTDKYEAAIIKINGDGEIEKEVTFSHDDISKFKDSVYLDDKIVVVGVFGKKIDDVLNASGLLVTYDINLEKVDEKFYTNNKTYSFTKIINNDGKYLAIGNTNSRINNKYLKTNGLDFYPVIEKEA